MSNPVKSIVKGAKKVFKNVTNAFKKNPLLSIAAIYVTGGAMGLWSTPFTSAGAGAAAATTAAPSTPLALASAANPAVVATTTGAPLTAAGNSLAAIAPNTAAAVNTAASMVAPAPAMIAPTIGSSLKAAANSMLQFVEKYPSAGLIAGNVLSSAFTPTQAEQQIEVEKWRRANSSFYGVPGTSSVAQGTNIDQLFNIVGKPQGLVTSNMRR